MSNTHHPQNNGIKAPFEAYTGDGPYVFVSYAHADKSIVFEAMNQLHEKGANIWYDEGIKPAGEWVEEIARAIKGSALFLVFVSPRSVDSRYVRSEVGYALSENKEILTLFIEETTLPAGLALCLQQFQSIFIGDSSWKDKAIQAVFTRMDAPIPSPTKESNEEEGIIDQGEMLWHFWQKARQKQLQRWKNFRAPAPALKSVDAEASLFPALTNASEVKSSSTRHPFAIKVNVSDSRKEAEVEKDNFKDPVAGEFCRIPAGDVSIKVPYSDETKIVRVRKGFWMSRFLITQEVYTQVMGSNPSFFDASNGAHETNLPVNNVSWLDAVSFCKALTTLCKSEKRLLENHEFRLPTEVEWEYACRGGSDTIYYFGDQPGELQEHAWFRGNSQKRIHPVGLKKPNQWGLHDMYGNVREWVGNSFVNTLLNDSEQDEFRISRGGAYMKPSSECQSASRSTNSLNHRFRNLGFRPVLAKVSN